MGTSSSRAKYQVIFDDIREAIRKGTYHADDQLPSERELAETYGVTRATARRALRDLEQMGLVRREGARGTRVLPHANGAPVEITTLVCTTEPLAAACEFMRQGTLLCEKKKWGTRILRLNVDESLPLQRSLNVGNPHLIYTERLDFADDAKLTSVLRQTKTPVVVIGNDLSEAGIQSVICDDAAGMRMALEHLEELGHSRIALVCGREDIRHAVLQTMIGQWEAFMRETLGQEDLARYLIRMEDHPFESLIMEAYDVIRDHLRQPVGQEITAMICLKEELAVGAMAACRDVDRAVPDTMSVLEYAPTPRAKLATIPRTLIDVHLDRHVSKALDLLMKKPAPSRKKGFRHLIRPTLVPGQSVKRR